MQANAKEEGNWLLHKLMMLAKCMRLSMVQCIVLRHTRQKDVTSRFVQQPRNSPSCTTDSFARWARFYDPFLSLFRLKGVRREMVERSEVRRDDRVLDVCTGTGDVALAFAERCEDITGIDLSPAMLAVARKKDREGPVRFLQMDATRLDFSDEEFDVSSISFALHDLAPGVREEVLREVRRVTRGRIVILDYNPPANRLLRSIYIAIASLWESSSFLDFARRDFKGLLTRCGLKVRKEKSVWLGLLRICVCCRE